MNRTEIAQRIPSLATSLLADKGYVAPVDLLLALGWLKPQDHAAWRFRRIPYLEQAVSVTLSRLTFTMAELHRYARSHGLRPSWTAYVSWGSHPRVPLRFSRSRSPEIEPAYATHWVPLHATSTSPDS